MEKNSIGQFIAALRKANGMTQQDVADRLNVSNKAVSRWERGECAPDLYAIPALAEMFGISYGIYRPVIGFAVMLLFEVCALAIVILAVSRTRDVKTDNELFEMADDTLIAKFNHTFGALSFMAFFVIFAIILMSLPLILVTSDYVNSVMTPYSYFTIFFGGILWILALLYLICKKAYMAWITNNQFPLKEETSAKNRRTMTAIQVNVTILAGIIFVLTPYFDFGSTDIFLLCGAFMGLACLLANIIGFAAFLIKYKNERKELVLPGIRNIFLIPSALIVSRMHIVSWISYGSENDYLVDALERHDEWHPAYFWYAVALAIIVFVVFSLIEALINRKSRI